MDELEVFEASNGYRIVHMGKNNPAGWVKILNRNTNPNVNERHSLGLYSLDALREFFRAEEQGWPDER